MKIEFRGNAHTNHFASRFGEVPDIIVNHVVAGSGQSCDNWFRSPNNTVGSAHFLVWEDGTVTQYVDIRTAAWANGLAPASIPNAKSALVRSRKENPNLYSVSIEHAGHTGKLTPEQFKATVALHKHIQDEVKRIYGITIPFNREHILGHFEIDPVRKPFCPGPEFPWKALMNELQEEDEPAKTSKPTASKPSSKTYTVKRGDTLSEIADKYDTTVDKLKSLNGIKDANKIDIGDVIKLPSAPAKKYHTVESGDTVSELAQRFGSTIAQIKEWNKLDSKYTIHPKDKLRVK